MTRVSVGPCSTYLFFEVDKLILMARIDDVIENLKRIEVLAVKEKSKSEILCFKVPSPPAQKGEWNKYRQDYFNSPIMLVQVGQSCYGKFDM